MWGYWRGSRSESENKFTIMASIMKPIRQRRVCGNGWRLGASFFGPVLVFFFISIFFLWGAGLMHVCILHDVGIPLVFNAFLAIQCSLLGPPRHIIDLLTFNRAHKLPTTPSEGSTVWMQYAYRLQGEYKKQTRRTLL